MNGEVCLTPSKWGQCTFLAGHTGPHRSPSGYDWKDEVYSQRSIHNQEKMAVDTLVHSKAMDKVEIASPIKRGPGRPRKWFKDENGTWYKNE